MDAVARCCAAASHAATSMGNSRLVLRANLALLALRYALPLEIRERRILGRVLRRAARRHDRHAVRGRRVEEEGQAVAVLLLLFLRGLAARKNGVVPRRRPRVVRDLREQLARVDDEVARAGGARTQPPPSASPPPPRPRARTTSPGADVARIVKKLVSTCGLSRTRPAASARTARAAGGRAARGTRARSTRRDSRARRRRAAASRARAAPSRRSSARRPRGTRRRRRSPPPRRLGRRRRRAATASCRASRRAARPRA